VFLYRGGTVARLSAINILSPLTYGGSRGTLVNVQTSLRVGDRGFVPSGDERGFLYFFFYYSSKRKDLFWGVVRN
jgi:hypothetical protein